MAKIEFKGIEAYQKRLAQLGRKSESVCRYAIYDAAGAVVEAIKANAPVDTGDLRDSIVLAPMKNEDGFVHTKVDIVGYDRKGVPNLLKARALESGTSRLPKKPFIRPAVRRVENLTQLLMEKSLDEIISRIMKN